MENKQKASWIDVYKFTFLQAVKRKGFIISTVLISTIILAATIIVNMVLANKYEEKNRATSIKNVYVINNTDIENVDFNIVKDLVEKKYDNVNFIQCTVSKEEQSKAISKEDGKDVVVELVKNDESYSVNLYIPEKSSISKADGKNFVEDLVTAFQQNKLISSNVETEKLVLLLSNVNTIVLKADGQEDTIGTTLAKLLLPMVCSLIFYTMILMYGQTISKSVIAEKSSKLMEMLLVTIKPSDIISGKIFAMASVAIMQFLTWSVSLIVGLGIGKLVSNIISPEYKNIIFQIIDLIKEDKNSSAFSIPSIVIAVLILCLGFVFFSILAGMVSASVSKAEDLANGMGTFQMLVLASFFITYFLPLKDMDGGSYSKIFSFIPFFAPFSIPADLIVGNISIVYGIISIVIILIFIVIFAKIEGKIYKDKVFYNGTKKLLKFKSKL